MKFKRLFQILVLLTLVFSSFGSQHVSASTNSPSTPTDAIVINRNLNVWDATYIGFVSSNVFEKWHLDLTEAHDFVVTVSPITGDLVPLLILQDSSGNELAHGTGTLTTTQPAGTYFIETQPVSGSGFYVLTLRQVVNTQPSVATTVSPTSLNVGESAVVTVSLNNVPAEGYTSAEFTCTYNASLVEVNSNSIIVTSLFGADAAVAINNPQSDSFIVAIAGSNGNKATTSGTAFTFSVKGLQAGQSAIECTARVSKGDNVLTSISSTGTSLTILGSTPTPTFTPTLEASPTPTFTSTPTGSATATSTSDGSATATFTPTLDGSATATATNTSTPTPTGSVTPTDTSTPEVSPTPTATQTSTPEASPTPTFTSTPTASPTPLPAGSLNGQVLASKPVTVSLYNADNSLAASVTVNANGTFNLQVSAGTYTVFATASGFLSAQGSVTIAGGAASTMPTLSLLAGDIDNNNVIDQLDAMTIGMNYNTADPAAADLNNDGVINVLDLELLARNYRKTGPTAWQ
jgi:carboxypeptidase family protein/cohesin domain-containing protein/dockerin type I repeat protein